MRKKSLLITATLLTVTIMLCYPKINPVIISNKTENNFKPNILSVNLETEAESGVYEESTISDWPEEGYAFNQELSRCEQGSEITWNDINKKVIIKSNKSDKCYVYFDKKEDKTRILNVNIFEGGIDKIEINDNKVVQGVFNRVYEVGDIPPEYSQLDDGCLPYISEATNIIEIYLAFSDGTDSQIYSETEHFQLPPACRGNIIEIIYNGEVIQQLFMDN